MHTRTDLAHLTNESLSVEVMRAAANERWATTQVIAPLAEFDPRRLYLREGFSSLYGQRTCRQAALPTGVVLGRRG